MLNMYNLNVLCSLKVIINIYNIVYKYKPHLYNILIVCTYTRYKYKIKIFINHL